MPATAVVNLAFWLALAFATLKLFEIALRPHQKKWLQSKMETFTLTVDYWAGEYRHWLRLLRKVTRSQVYLLAIVALIGCVKAIETGDKYLVLGGMIGLLVSLSFFAAAGLWHRSQEFLDWLGSDKLTYKSVLRILGMAGVIIAIIALRILGNTGQTAAEILSVLLSVCALIYFAGAPRKFILWNAFSSLAIVIGAALAAAIVVAFVAKFAVAILWRIIEYPSGAWSAVIFLVASVLGYVKVFVA